MARHRVHSAAHAGNPYADADVVRVRRRVFPRDSLWPWIISVSVFCIVAVFGWFSLSLLLSVDSAREHASVVVDHASGFLSAAKAGDQEALKRSAQGVSNAAHEIKDELNASIWEFASRLPIIGTDVDDVRVLADVLIDVSDNALVPMAESGNVLALQNLAKDDSIDFTALPGLLAALDEAMPALNRSARTLEALPPATMPPIANALGSTTQGIATLNSFLVRIRPLFPYLPELLGADGRTRNYLVLAQNNAEIHAIGGFVGSLGVLTVTNGKIEMGDFNSLRTVLSLLDDSSGATDEEIAAFGIRCDTHHGDHNVIPDFSRVGQLYFNIWNYYHDYELDGVLGFDPVFLQYLLDTFGPIETSYGVTVDGSNCAAIMLNQSLFWWKPDECDAFYSEVAGEALSRILGNLDDVDASKFLSAITKAVDENRCMVWIHDDSAEGAIKSAGFGGETKHDATRPELGVFISDASTSKMSYYLSNDVVVGEPTINEDGSQSYEVEVTITNNFDPDARDYLPSYVKVVAEGLGKRSNYDLYEEVRIIAPEGGSIQNISHERLNTRSDTPSDTQWVERSYQGLMVQAADLRIDAQESAVIRFTVVTSPEVVEQLTVRKTPLMPPDIAYWNVDLAESNPSWNIEKTV